MSWVLKSSETGEEYEFADDVDQQRALAFVKQKEMPADTLSVVKGAVANVRPSLAKGVAGIVQAGADVGAKLGIPGAEELQRTNKAAIAAMESDIRANTPANMSIGQEALASSITNAPEMLATAGAVMATGGAAALPALARGGAAAIPTAMRAMAPAVGAGITASSLFEGLREYGSLRQEKDIAPAAGQAALHAAAQQVGEKFSNKPLKDMLEKGTLPAVKQFAMQLFGREIAGEELTTFLEEMNRAMWDNKDITTKEFGQNLLRQFAVTGLSAGMTGATMSGAGAAAVKGLDYAMTPTLKDRAKFEPTLTADTSVIAPQPQETEMVSVPETPQKTRLSGGFVEGAGGLLVPVDMPENPPVELPIDLQFQRLLQREETAKGLIAELQTPGFQAGAEEVLAHKKAIQNASAELEAVAGERTKLYQMVADDPKLEAMLVDKQLGEAFDPLQLGLQKRALEVVNQTPRMAERPMESLAKAEALAGTNITEPPASEPSFFRGIDYLPDSFVQGVAPSSVAPDELQAYVPGSALNGTTPQMLVQNMQPGEVQLVVAKNGSSQAATSFLPQVRDVMQSWVKAFAPDMKIVLGHAGDHPKYAGARGWVQRGDDTYMVFAPKENTESNFWSTVSHEFGHALIAHLFAKQDKATQSALVNAYQQDRKALQTMTFREGVKLIAATQRAEDLITLAKQMNRRSLDKPFYETMALVKPDLLDSAYYLSFDEWLAENMSKYMHTRIGVTPEAKGFFSKVLDALSKMYLYLKEHTLIRPNVTFAQWADNVLLEQGQGKAGREATGKLQSEMLKSGIRPEIASMLEAAGQDKTQFAEAENLRVALQNATMQRKINELQQRGPVAQMVRSLLPLMQKATAYGKAKSKAQVMKLISAAVDRQSTILRDRIQDIAMSPEFDSKYIDAQKLLATILTKLGGWRVSKETTVDRGNGVQETIVEVDTLDKPFRLSYSQDGQNIASFAQDVPAQIKESEKAQMVLVALHSAARQGVKSLQVSATQPELARMLDNFTSGQLLDTGLWEYNIPYWAYEMNDRPDTMDSRFGGTPASMLGKVANFFGNRAMKNTSDALGRFNFVFGKALGAFQMLKLNIQVPGAVEVREGFRNRMKYRSEWLRPADAAVELWQNLPKAEAEGLSKLLYDEAQRGDAAQNDAQRAAAWMSTQMDDPERPGHSVYMLSEAALRKYGLSEKAAEVYSNIRDFYMSALKEMEKVGYYEIARRDFDEMTAEAVRHMIAQQGTTEDLRGFLLVRIEGTPQKSMRMDEPQKAQMAESQIKKLQSEFAEIARKPYTPYPRFGQWAVRVKENGKVVYFETFETESAQGAAIGEVAKMFPNGQTSKTYIEDTAYVLQGVPPSFMDAVAKNLNLTPEQLTTFKEYQFSQMNANAFLQKMRKRKGIEGYTEDAMRGFADYSRKFSNHVARVKAQAEIQQGLKLMDQWAKDLENTQNGNANNVRRLHEWLTKTNRYINEVGNELGEVKSLVSLWHFGFNISSAAVNLLQVPMVSLPYLSQRFGVKETMVALTTAYKDLAKWDMEKLDDGSRWMLEEGLKAGFINESFATTLAQAADGYALTQAQPLQAWRKKLGKVNHYAMWMFQKAEEVNRRATALAAFREARRTGMTLEDAFDFARGAVEDTQGEYAIENRPEFMRGNWSVIFQFMQFQQNMLFQMFGGDKSWKRMLAAHLMLAGVMGMPLAGDLTSMWKMLWRVFGEKEADVEAYARQMLSDMHINADLILNGVSSNVFGFDLSKRISMGDVIPGMKAAGSHQKFNSAMADAAGDMAGPGIGMVINAMRFIAEDDPRLLHRMQKIMPSAVRNLTRAIEAEIEGGVKDRDGALLYDPGIWQSVGYAAGFAPKELSREYNVRGLTQEVGTYWTRRRSSLLEQFDYAQRNGKDTEEIIRAVVDYNAAAPDRNLVISTRTIRQSVERRREETMRRQAGYGANRMTDEIERQFRQQGQ